MKRQTYSIKHDFLYNIEPCEIIPVGELNDKHQIVKLSKILNAKDETSFNELFDPSIDEIAIKDDIGECLNPKSTKFKKFIISCVVSKLATNGFVVRIIL